MADKSQDFHAKENLQMSKGKPKPITTKPLNLTTRSTAYASKPKCINADAKTATDETRQSTYGTSVDTRPAATERLSSILNDTNNLAHLSSKRPPVYQGYCPALYS